MYGVIEFAGHGMSKGGFDNGDKINEPLLCISMWYNEKGMFVFFIIITWSSFIHKSPGEFIWNVLLIVFGSSKLNNSTW